MGVVGVWGLGLVLRVWDDVSGFGVLMLGFRVSPIAKGVCIENDTVIAFDAAVGTLREFVREPKSSIKYDDCTCLRLRLGN